MKRQLNVVIAKDALDPYFSVLAALSPGVKGLLETHPETAIQLFESPIIQGILTKLRGPPKRDNEPGPWGS